MRHILTILFLLPVLAHATTYHFANSGNDGTGNGSISTPYATKTKLKLLSLNPGDSVLFNRGDDFATGPAIYAVSGVNYNAYGSGADPIVDGLYQLTGGTNLGNGVYQFYVPLIKQNCNLLVMDGSNEPICKYPDNGFLLYTSINSSGIGGTSMAGLPYNFTGATVVIQDEFYNIDSLHINAQTSSSITTATSPNFTGARGAGYFVMNDPRIMPITGITGCWYNNYSKDSIQVKLPSGLGSHIIYVSIADTLFYASSVSNISVGNINFRGANQFSIFQNNTYNVTFTNCKVNNSGLNGVKANNCPHTYFVNDSITWSNNNAFLFSGSTSTQVSLLNSYINYTGTLPGMGTGSTTGTSGYTAFSDAFGRLTIIGNTILNSGYAGIYFSGDSINISKNIINGFCLTKVDGGGIYSWDAIFQTYTFPRNVDSNTIINGQGPNGGIVNDPTDLSHCLYFDGHSTSITAWGNICAYSASSGILIHGSSMIIYNNTFFGNLYSQVYLSRVSTAALTGLYFKNNYIANSQAGQDIIVAFSSANDLASFGSIDSNYYGGYTADVTPFLTQANGGSLTSHNLTGWQGIMTDVHSTYQTGISTSLATNSTSSYGTFSIAAIYYDFFGKGYYNSINLSAYSAIILFFSRNGTPRHIINTTMQKPGGTYTYTSGQTPNRFIGNKGMQKPSGIITAQFNFSSTASTVTGCTNFHSTNPTTSPSFTDVTTGWTLQANGSYWTSYGGFYGGVGNGATSGSTDGSFTQAQINSNMYNAFPSGGPSWSAGEYSFSFTNLPAGTYSIYLLGSIPTSIFSNSGTMTFHVQFGTGSDNTSIFNPNGSGSTGNLTTSGPGTTNVTSGSFNGTITTGQHINISCNPSGTGGTLGYINGLIIKKIG